MNQRPRTPASTLRRALGVVVVLLLVASALYLAAGSARRAAVGAATGSAAGTPAPQPRAGPAPVADGAAPAAAPGSWAGSTLETLLPNYNGSLPGDLRSLVADWRVGQPAVDPLTKTVWWPEYPTSLDSSTYPSSAPALLYNDTTNTFVGFDDLVRNTSAIAYDPAEKLLYATEPADDAVIAVNASSGVPTGVSYPVGTDPLALLYDSASKDLFVANYGSSNVTVIDPASSDDAVEWSGITVQTGPIAFADDSTDGWVYVADSGAPYVSVLNTTDLSKPVNEVTLFDGPASGIAYSVKGTVGVTSSGSANMTVLSAKDAAVVSATIAVGKGCGPITAAHSGGSFVVANTSGASVVLVNTSLPFNVSSTRFSVAAGPSEILSTAAKGEVLVWGSAARAVSVVSAALTRVTSTTPTLAPAPSLLAYDPSSQALVVGDDALPGFEVLNWLNGTNESPPFILPSKPLAFAFEANTSLLWVGLNNDVQEYNLSTDLLVYQNDTLAGLNAPLVLDPSSGLLWDGRGSQGVEALTASTLVATGAKAAISVPQAFPSAMTFDPVAGSVLAVSNYTSGDVEQFNGTYGTAVGTAISAGPNVSALTWDPADGLVYAAGTDLAGIVPATMTLGFSSVPLAPHAHVGGIVYEPSREAVYVSTWTNSSDSGLLNVVNGSSPSGAYSSLTVIPTGFSPEGLAVIPTATGGLADSGVVLSANSVSGTISVVASPPQILSAGFTPAEIDQNATTQLVVTATGGAGPSTVGYTGLPGGCASADTLVLNCTPGAMGSFSVLVNITDALGESATTAVGLTVSSSLTLAAVVGKLSSHDVDVNVSVAMTAIAGEGTPDYAYAWNFGDGSTAVGGTVSHTFTRTGEYIVSVTATDQGGGSVVNETLVTVEPDPSAELAASPATFTDVGLSLNLDAVVAGGSGAGTGLWTFGDGTTSPNPVVSHAWAKAGDYAVNYTYEDALGVSAPERTLEVEVNPPLTGSFSVAPLAATPIVGTVFDFNASLSGGTPGYTVTWSFGDGSMASGLRVTHAYALAGTYEVEVTATDTAGASVKPTFSNITVGHGPSGSGPLLGGGFGPSFALGLVLGAVGAAVAIFLAERRRKAGPIGPPSPYVPPAPAERRTRP